MLICLAQAMCQALSVGNSLVQREYGKFCCLVQASFYEDAAAQARRIIEAICHDLIRAGFLPDVGLAALPHRLEDLISEVARFAPEWVVVFMHFVRRATNPHHHVSVSGDFMLEPLSFLNAIHAPLLVVLEWYLAQMNSQIEPQVATA